MIQVQKFKIQDICFQENQKEVVKIVEKSLLIINHKRKNDEDKENVMSHKNCQQSQKEN